MAYPYYGYGQYPNPNMDNLQYLKSQQIPNQFQNGTSLDERIWVQGKISADAYLVAPNSFVRLWDSTQNVFYEKRADQTGRPYMETYEYKKQEYTQPKQENENYNDRFTAIEKRLQALEGVSKNVSESVNDVATVPTVQE